MGKTTGCWVNVWMPTDKLRLSFSLFVSDKQMALRKPAWPYVVRFKKIDFAEPTPLIDQVDLGCTHSEIVSKESNVKTKIDLFAKITTTDTEAKSTDKTETRQVVSWSYDMKGLAGKNRGTFSC